jgi:outer membrane protein assembly factor BamB
VIYAGGDFAHVGGAARTRLAAVDVATGSATAWNPGADSNISSLAVAPNAIYAAGSFGQIGGQPRQGLAALDPTSGTATAWSPQGIQIDARRIVVAGAQVYASGFFILDDANSTRANLVALDTQTGQVQNRFPAVSGNTVPTFLVDATTVYVSSGSATHEGSDFTFGAYDRGSAAEHWRHRITGEVAPLAIQDGLLYTGGGLKGIDYVHVERLRLAAFRASDGYLTVWQPPARGGVIDIFPTATNVYGFVVIAYDCCGFKTSYVYSFQELGRLHESHMSLPILMR